MANILDAIVSQANSIRTSSNPVATVAGKVGKAIDYLGTSTGQILPDLNISEKLESYGAQAIPTEQRIVKVQSDPRFTQSTGTNPSYPKIASVPDQPSAPSSTQYKQQQDVPSGDTGWARTYLSDSNSGKVVWDDNLRAKAESILRGPEQQKAPEPIGREDIAGAYRDVFGEDASSEKLNAMMEAWGGQTRDRARALAEEQYRIETEAAERGYGDTMGQLRVQKGEVGTLGQQQRERIAKEKEIGTAEFESRRAKQEKEIGEQSEKFGKQMKGERETLARNWRDMSMELQRIMRARGVQDSSYSADKEARAMSEFNLGLNKLAETSQEAFKDFADAVVETNAFYKAEQNKLDFNAQQAQQDVDNWVRQRVQDIQAQENVALSKKLNEINGALAKANQLKAQVEQKIADQKMNMDTWLYQTMTNYKNAVSLAAQGKVQSAQTSVKDAFALSTAIGQQLSNKMATIREVPGATGQYQVYGQLPTGATDEYGNLITVPYSVPATAEQYAKYTNPSTTDQILQTVQNQQSGGGILDAIGSLFQ